MNVIMSPGGGHGSVFIWQRSASLNMMARPDTTSVFGWDWSHTDLPVPEAKSEFYRRTAGYRLDLNKTIGENVLQALASHQPHWAMLSGNVSKKSPWLTANRIKAFGLVRHPLDAAASLLLHRHPEIVAQQFNGVVADAFKWYGELWSSVVKDLLMSDSPIWNYEKMPEACYEVADIYQRLRPSWNAPPPLRRRRELKEEWCDVVWKEVKCVFGDAGYSRWR